LVPEKIRRLAKRGMSRARSQNPAPIPLAARLGAAILRHGTDAMNLKQLLGIRPKSTATPAELAEAIVAADAAQREAAARAQTLTAQRGRLLLDGTPDEVSRNEIAIAAARDDAERASALAEALRNRVVETERAARKAAFKAKLSEARRANGRWRAFVESDYPGLAEKLAAGLKLEAEAIRAARASYYAFYELPEDERAGLEPSQGPELLPNVPEIGTTLGRQALGPRLVLPSIDGSAPYWTHQDHAGDFLAPARK